MPTLTLSRDPAADRARRHLAAFMGDCGAPTCHVCVRTVCLDCGAASAAPCAHDEATCSACSVAVDATGVPCAAHPYYPPTD